MALELGGLAISRSKLQTPTQSSERSYAIANQAYCNSFSDEINTSTSGDAIELGRIEERSSQLRPPRKNLRLENVSYTVEESDNSVWDSLLNFEVFFFLFILIAFLLLLTL